MPASILPTLIYPPFLRHTLLAEMLTIVYIRPLTGHYTDHYAEIEACILRTSSSHHFRVLGITLIEPSHSGHEGVPVAVYNPLLIPVLRSHHASPRVRRAFRR